MGEDKGHVFVGVVPVGQRYERLFLLHDKFEGAGVGCGARALARVLKLALAVTGEVTLVKRSWIHR